MTKLEELKKQRDELDAQIKALESGTIQHGLVEISDQHYADKDMHRMLITSDCYSKRRMHIFRTESYIELANGIDNLIDDLIIVRQKLADTGVVDSRESLLCRRQNLNA